MLVWCILLDMSPYERLFMGLYTFVFNVLNYRSNVMLHIIVAVTGN